MSETNERDVKLSGRDLSRIIQRGGYLMLIGEDGAILECSPGLAKSLEYRTDELEGRSLALVMEDKKKADGLLVLLQNHQTGSTGKLSLGLRSKRGALLRAECLLSVLRAMDGEEQYLFQVFLAAHEEVNLLQQFAGSFIRDVNLGVILVNLDFRLIDISDMACDILGVEREHILNKAMEEVFSNVPIEHQLVQRTILDGVVVRNHAISWMNNKERYELLMDSNLLRSDSGDIVGAYIIFKDVTNLRSLEEQVQRSDRLAMIGQIAAGTAHEIRNPLTSIKGFLQVLKKSLLEHGLEKECNFADIMLTEINRINDLVSEFLLLSKPKNIQFDAVDVSTVLREILPIINNEAILHNVDVQYQAAYRLPKVVADRELMKQVFLNICKNGIEAMPEGGTLVITEKLDAIERKVNVEIHDTGPGIPVFLIDKIFDPFFTTKEEGTGLGLSVCQRIIHDIGGSIRVSSKGFGTTFTVSIPFPHN